MDNYKAKRESLELFIQEQLIGPGAFNKRFFFLNKWEENEFFGKDLKEQDSLQNNSEILTEVPAYQYSSGILFPETRVKTHNKLPITIDDTEISGSDVDLENQNTSADDEDIKEDVSESLVSKQQNYPNSFGLSFVVDKGADLTSDVSLNLSFRKYRLVTKEEAIQNKLSCWISDYQFEVEEAVNKYLSPLFEIENKSGNYFLVLKMPITPENIYDIDYIRLNNFLADNLLLEIQKVFRDNLTLLAEKKNVKYFGIDNKTKVEFYSIAPEKEYVKIKYFNVITIFNNGLVNFIKTEIEEDSEKYIIYKDLIKHLELYNQLKDIITDLKSVFKPKNSSPIWESKKYDGIKIKLPPYIDNNIFRKSAIPICVDEKQIDDLQFAVQYITKKEEVFIKVIVTNKSFIVLEEGEPPQLNKKNEANIKSFLGIKLCVDEKKQNVLKQYNPPQLLSIDEEDSFNKLLYRNYHDFGEGYNTSVNWGLKDNLKFICTDFLPHQETPKVDFQPSKIINNKTFPRIDNNNILSIRFLSTLSNIDDSKILDGLTDFIEKYREWIIEKENDLINENDLTFEQKSLLSKQLLACHSDFTRLKRNIQLLRNDPQALAAFRIMNTAMFMQLHHGRGISQAKKSNLKAFKTFENNEDFYKKTICIEYNDYKWRSFQLAFIILNIDGFVKPHLEDTTVEDIFGTKWPERNELADLVWFPTGGGKTEAYLGIIAFVISYRRFKKGVKGLGTTVLMRYTLRLLTLQQFQRATLLICALEIIRKENFQIPQNYEWGNERISIGLFVGSGSLPNKWKGTEKSMENELKKIAECIKDGNRSVVTNLPFTACPWCGGELFIDKDLNNVSHKSGGENYGKNDQLSICCNVPECAFAGKGSKNRPTVDCSLPLRLFDDDIYKFPPTLLFGTVDKFAALANKVSTATEDKDNDSRRLFGKGKDRNYLPPELIIQDELHLLLGPLGSAVGLFEKSIDHLCTYVDNDLKIKPKIITSTATTRNTDKQIFALFNRRSEIFPKQGILCDDSFFAFYERNTINTSEYVSNRKYIGILPVGKTQVWMQLRIAAICLTHRLKYFKQKYSNADIFEDIEKLNDLKSVFDYYHTVLSYFNSLKDVGKTQSQLSHYLPGDVNFVTKNTNPWNFLDKIIRNETEIDYSELTGRLSGEEVKTNLSRIETKWSLFELKDGKYRLNTNNPPEFVISTNMISVGIDIERFNTMLINSMPRNVAEYIQASSRVARKREGLVLTIHHPFRSRDISHYQRFKEFHEKFYSYVEPISVTPFANKALDRYFPIFLAVMIRHTILGLSNNKEATKLNVEKIKEIKDLIMTDINEVLKNALNLEAYLTNRQAGIRSSVDGIIGSEEVGDIDSKLDKLIEYWFSRLNGSEPKIDLEYRTDILSNSLFMLGFDENYPTHWKVGYSLREIDPSIIIKTVQQ